MIRKLKIKLASAASTVAGWLVFILAAPLVAVGYVLVLCKRAIDWIELWGAYRGDKAARDKDRWRGDL